MNFYPVYCSTNNNWDRNYCRIHDLHYSPQLTQAFLNRKMPKPEYNNHYRHGYGGYNSHYYQFHNPHHPGRQRQHNHHNHHHPGFPFWVLQQPRVNIQHGLLLRLNKEIEHVCNVLRPSKEECQLREKIIDRIRESVQKKWSTAKVEVFGSFKTDLYLPTSDIDLVVLDSNLQRAPFYELKDKLVALSICDKDKVVVLDNASVPIIKLTDKLNNIKIDIGFNIANAQESASLTQKFMSEFPSLQYLVIVLKQFLVERELNEVYTGGISSYSLILMVISFLKSFKGMPGIEMSNYGHLLLSFLHYYTKEFNYMSSAVSIKSSTGFVPRTETQNMLSIQDPLCDGNDVARGSYRFICVRNAFADALDHLNLRLKDNVPHSISHKNLVILSGMISVPAERQCCSVGHFVDGSGDMSNNAGSSSPSLIGSGEPDSDSNISSSTVLSESSSNCSDQRPYTSTTALSSISAPSPTDSSLPPSSESSLSHKATYHSESVDEIVRLSSADETAVNERLSALRIEDGAEFVPPDGAVSALRIEDGAEFVPPDGAVCDDNNNNIEKGKDELEDKRLNRHSQHPASRSKSKCPEISGASSRVVVSADRPDGTGGSIVR